MGYVSELRKRVGHMPAVVAFSVLVIISKDHRLLLEERADDHYWDFPGGSIEFNETALEAAKREVKEETALAVGEAQLLGVYSGPLTYYKYANGDEVSGVDIVYYSSDYHGTLQEQKEEVSTLRWFDLQNPPEKMSPRNKQIIKDLLAIFQK
jgi:8-oxo-dGTP pyrophosphatase MutT (NUDIX family)